MKTFIGGILTFMIVGVAFFILTAPPQVSETGTASSQDAATQEDTSAETADNINDSATFGEPPIEKTMRATIETAKGNIVLDLYPDVAPKTVENFAKLAKENFYDGTTFHRVVEDFVIQGGDPNSKDSDPANDGQGGPGYQFEDEMNAKSLGLSDEEVKTLEEQGYRYQNNLVSLPVEPGYIAMANSGPNTNGSQFFIVSTKPQPHLNGKHTVFGKVVEGMEVALAVMQGDVINAVRISE